MALRVFLDSDVDKEYDTYFVRNLWTTDKCAFWFAGATLAVWSLHLSSGKHSGRDIFDGLSGYILTYLLLGAVFRLRYLCGFRGPPLWRSVAVGLTRISLALCTAKASGSMEWRYHLPRHPVIAIAKAIWFGTTVPQMLIVPLSAGLKFREHLLTQTIVAAILIATSMEPFCDAALQSPGAPFLLGFWQKLENCSKRISLSIYTRVGRSPRLSPFQSCMHVSVFFAVFFGWGLSSYFAWLIEENFKRRFLEHRMRRNQCDIVPPPQGKLTILVKLIYHLPIWIFAFFICWESVEYFYGT